MRQRKGLLRIYRLVFIPVLFLVILILFRWYSGENSKRIEEQNRNYAADSARPDQDICRFSWKEPVAAKGDGRDAERDGREFKF